MAYSTVRYGSSGNDVSELQRILNENGYNLDVDGIFGSQTQAAVTDYQTNRGLDIDGIVGPQTWGSLTGTSATAGAGSEAGAAVTGSASGSESGSAKKSYYEGINTTINPITTQNYLAGVNTNVPTISSAGVSAATQASLGQYEAGYTPSATVNAAYEMLQNQLNAKPGDYESKWTEQLDSLYNQITNRDPFSYDLNSDMLYQQYKDQYTNLGQMAMMDTMGQAAGLTGGYGSSYSQSVGQQAYNAYLQNLNQIVPDLYQMAYQQYRDQGNDLLNQWSMTRDMDATDYARYRDNVADYYTNLNFAYGMYNDERSFDYNDYANMLNYWQNKYQMEQDQSNWEAQFNYQQQADAVARAMQMASMLQDQENWNAQFNYSQQSDAIAREMQLASLMQDQENWDKSFNADEAYRAWQMANAGGSGGGGGGGYGGGGYYYGGDDIIEDEGGPKWTGGTLSEYINFNGMDDPTRNNNSLKQNADVMVLRLISEGKSMEQISSEVMKLVSQGALSSEDARQVLAEASSKYYARNR